MARPARGGRNDIADPEVVQADACLGFLVSSDGSRVRLELSRVSGEPWLLELPASGVASLLKSAAEAQQKAIPREAGKAHFRVVRRPVNWSLERDMADDVLTLVLVTADGFEWCFSLADEEVLRMAECLRDERMVTVPAPPAWQ